MSYRSTPQQEYLAKVHRDQVLQAELQRRAENQAAAQIHSRSTIPVKQITINPDSYRSQPQQDYAEAKRMETQLRAKVQEGVMMQNKMLNQQLQLTDYPNSSVLSPLITEADLIQNYKTLSESDYALQRSTLVTNLLKLVKGGGHGDNRTSVIDLVQQLTNNEVLTINNY